MLKSTTGYLRQHRAAVISHALMVVAVLVATGMLLLDYIGVGEEGIGTLEALGLVASVLVLILAFALHIRMRRDLLVLARSTVIVVIVCSVGSALYWVASDGPQRLRYLRQQAEVQFERDQPIHPQPLNIRLEVAATGFDEPVAIVSGPEDALYIVERGGTIRVFQDGAVLPDVFGDLSDRVLSQGKEQGLLGLAFYPPDPDVVFLYYTTTKNTAILSRFAAEDGRIDPSSEEILLRIEKTTEYHNGGNLIFGSDGYLYLGVGDDEHGDINAQNGQTLLGKILRLDVSQSPYSIPADNPFIGDDGVRDEIWALGLRNPWRFSFDAQSGDLFVADVGDHGSEEVNHIIDPKGGYNFGWKVYEGMTCVATDASECRPDRYTLPQVVYPSLRGCAITGGYVYRGTQVPALVGSYLFADYCSGYVWALKPQAGGGYSIAARHFEINSFATFGQDQDGELYLISHSSGVMYRIEGQ